MNELSFKQVDKSKSTDPEFIAVKQFLTKIREDLFELKFYIV